MPVVPIDFLTRWLPAMLWGVVILVLSLMPGGAGNLMWFGIPHMDKVGHFGMYGVWTFLFFYGLSDRWQRDCVKAFWVSACMVAATGVVLEFGQYVMGRGRSFEVADMVANAAGAITGALAGWVYYRHKTSSGK